MSFDLCVQCGKPKEHKNHARYGNDLDNQRMHMFEPDEYKRGWNACEAEKNAPQGCEHPVWALGCDPNHPGVPDVCQWCESLRKQEAELRELAPCGHSWADVKPCPECGGQECGWYGSNEERCVGCQKLAQVEAERDEAHSHVLDVHKVESHVNAVRALRSHYEAAMLNWKAGLDDHDALRVRLQGLVKDWRHQASWQVISPKVCGAILDKANELDSILKEGL